MKILDHTEEHSPTFMRDIYAELIGSEVVVHLQGGSHPIGGKLSAYNGAVVHLTSTLGIGNTYIPADKIIAISSER